MPRLFFTTSIILPLALLACVFLVKPASALIISKTPSTPPSLNTGLVGWWTMDAPDVTVTTTTDKSGSGNNGTRAGGTTAVLGKIGQAMKFDGSSGYVNGHDNPVLASTNITVSAWINSRNIATEQMITSKYFDQTGLKGLALEVYGAKLTFSINAGAFKQGTTVMSTGKWYHVVATYNGSVINLYVNGVPDGTLNSAAGITNPTGNFEIGRYTYSSNLWFNGTLDDVRVYNRALSASEIQQLYKLGGGKINKTPTVPPTLKTGLVGWWTMDGPDVTATTVTDKSGSGNNGTRTAVTPVVGKIGQAMKFNGVSGYITLPATGSYTVRGNLGFTSGDKFSLSIWYKGTDTSGLTYGKGLISWNSNGIYSGFILKNGYAVFMHYNSSWLYNIISTTMVADGKWHQITYVNNNNLGYLYVDGIKEINGLSSTIGGGSYFFQPYHIGSTYDNVFTSGSMDDVRIYSRTLSATEIQQLYKLGGGKINKTPTTPPTLKTGLVGHWTFDGMDTTVTTATDKSGNGNNGTRAGGTAVTTGKIGQAMKFDGSTGNLLTNLVPTIGTGNITYSVWFKTGTSQNGGIMAMRNGSTATQFSLLMSGANDASIIGTKILPYSYDGATIRNAITTATYADNQWHHAVLVHTTASDTLYMDGAFATTMSVADQNISASTKVLVGCHADSDACLAGGYFQGSIDDARVYSRALSAAEIQQLYKMGR